MLTHAHAAIVGVGATGAATASLLARAGVGHLTLIDRDIVEPSNLQRQILFDEADASAASPKAHAAKQKIAHFNSAVLVDAHVADLVPANVDELLSSADLLLDCTDNFETRYLLNDFAVKHGKPWIYAAAVGSFAATMNILPACDKTDAYASTGCLACLFPAQPSGVVETCDTAGILGAAVNLAASIQSAEALKFLTGQAELMRRTFLSWDLWASRHAEISNGAADPECAVCGKRQFRYLNGTARPHITLCGRNSVQIHEHHKPLNLADLHRLLAGSPEIEDVRSNPMLLRFRRGKQQITVFPDGRALIQGTTDAALARSLYSRFVGS